MEDYLSKIADIFWASIFGLQLKMDKASMLTKSIICQRVQRNLLNLAWPVKIKWSVLINSQCCPSPRQQCYTVFLKLLVSIYIKISDIEILKSESRVLRMFTNQHRSTNPTDLYHKNKETVQI